MAVATAPARGRLCAPRHHVGQVTVFSRGRTWSLCYRKNGHRIRRRVGPSLAVARNLAAQFNGRLASGAPPTDLSQSTRA